MCQAVFESHLQSSAVAVFLADVGERVKIKASKVRRLSIEGIVDIYVSTFA